MQGSLTYRIAADAVLVLHVAFIAFVVLGLLCILVGGALGWRWVRNPWFRLLHLLGIGVVVLQSWLGVLCPLTILEMALRGKAGQATYAGGFIAHWLGELLYFNAPMWVFAVAYTAFGLLVVAAHWRVRPRPFTRRQSTVAVH